MSTVTDLPAFPPTVIEDFPQASKPLLNPFIVAICLVRGAVRVEEVVTAAHSFFAPKDNKVGDLSDTQTNLEVLVESAIIDLLDRQALRRGSKPGTYVMNTDNMGFWLTVTTSLDSKLPTHFVTDVAKVYLPKVVNHDYS